MENLTSFVIGLLVTAFFLVRYLKKTKKRKPVRPVKGAEIKPPHRTGQTLKEIS